MSGPTSFRVSQETFELLKKNRDLYESIFDLQKKKESPLLPKATDAESRTESKVRDNGDVEVSLVLPLDDDKDASNGRIYVRDTFVFDASERVLKSHQRSFEYNGKGGDEWKGWLGKYEALPDSKGRPAVDPTVQKFAHRVARSYGRPIVDDSQNTLPEIKAAFQKETRLLKTTNQQVLDLKADLSFKIRDKLNFYNLVWRDGKLEVTVQFSVDSDTEEENGRILLRDKFKLDATTLAFEGLERSWSLAPGAAGDARLQAALRALQAKPDPSAEEAGAFIQTLLPAILPKGEADGSAVLALLGAGKTFPKDYQSSMARRGRGDVAGLKAAGEISLEAMYVVAQEQVMKRYDESQGWLHFGASVDQVKEKGILDSLFKKAKEASEKRPGTSPFEIFRGLELSPEETAQRDQILGDKLMRQLESLAQESDAALRGKALANLAQGTLLIEAGLAESAMFLAERLKEDPATRRTAEDILAIVQGKGNFGQKFEYVLPLFTKEVSKPSMLLGMAAAPFMGTAFELGGLRMAKWAYETKKVSDIGRGAKLGAAVLGMTGEAVGFTTIHRGFERLHHSGDKAWNGAWQEIVSATLMFGGMRLTHGATGLATARMAEGAWGSRLGYRFGEAEFAGGLGRSPTGRFFFDAAAPAAGKGIPTLTTRGKVLTGTMNHLGGILTMQASGFASRKLGLMPDNNQSFGANFFDASVMYAQAMVGAQLANVASGGALHRNLGEFRMGVENLKKGVPVTPPPPVATPDPAAQPTPDLAQAAAPQPPAVTPSVDPKTATPPPAVKAEATKPSFLERLKLRKAAKPEAQDPAANQVPAGAQPTKAESAQKPSLFDRLFAGREGGVKKAFEAAREWFTNLSPAKVKVLQAELDAARAKLAEAEQGNTEKGTKIGDLETQLAGLKAENETAKEQLEAKGQEIEGLKTRLSETKENQTKAEKTVEEKGQALAQAEVRLQELEAQKAEAEKRLQDYSEQAELSELDLGIGSLDQQIANHKAELGKLRAEKRDAEVSAGAHRQAADELRKRLTEAETELERRKGVDQALKTSESKAVELGERIAELQGSLEELQRSIGRLSAENDGASRLTTDQATKLVELQGLKGELEGKLEKALQDIAELRQQLSARDTELRTLRDNLEDLDAQLRSANHRIENQQRSVESLEKLKKSLETKKGELEQELAKEQGDKAAIQASLDETSTKLTETSRELNKTKLDLEITTSGRNSAREEASHLRESLEAAGKLRTELQADLGKKIRELEVGMKAQGKALEAAQKEIGEVQQSLAQQTERAQASEGREIELLKQQEALKAEHEATKTELGKAQRKIESLNRDIKAKEEAIERHKTTIANYQEQIKGLRTKKSELEESLRQLQVEQKVRDKELEKVKAELEAEKAKPAEIVEDISRITELEEQISDLTAKKETRDKDIAALEGAKAGLETQISELDTARKDLEKRLRATEADLEIANGAAKSAQEDLKTLKERSGEEETRLRKSIEDWRQRATDAEAGKATAEARIQKLGEEISEQRTRIGTLEREVAEKSSALRSAQENRKTLEANISKLESELAEQNRLLSLKETELTETQKDLREQIARLETDKLTQAKDIEAKVKDIERLNKELSDLGQKLSTVEQSLTETKAGAKKDRTALEAEKSKLEKDIETKAAELRQKDNALTIRQARVEELEGDLATANRSMEEAKRAFEAEKTKLGESIAERAKALSEGRSALEIANRELETLREELRTTRGDLAKEQQAAKEWKGKFEGLEATSKAEAKRLRSDAEELRKKEAEAVRKAGEAVAKVESLEAALKALELQKQESEAELSDKLTVAQQAAAREQQRASDADNSLSSAKLKHSLEAESLRSEAAVSGKLAKILEARAMELEASLNAERAELRKIQGELAAARAEAEALLAPASLRAEAEQKASDAGALAKRLQEELTVAQEGKKAAEQRVQALEKELQALRTGSESEAEVLRIESAAHLARAEAAEARAQAAEGRIASAEAAAEGARFEAAALRSDAMGRSQAEQSASKLRKEIEDLNQKVKAAEERATAADLRAKEFEAALTNSKQSAAESARHLDALKKEKASVDQELVDLKGKLEGTEAQLKESSQKRKKAEQELLGAQTRASDLEKQVKIKDEEIVGKTKELEEAKAQVTKIWGDSQKTASEAQRRIGELDKELTNLRNTQEGFEEQIKIERDRVKEVEQTLELLVAGEEALRKEVGELKGERNAANDRVRSLDKALAEKQAEMAHLQASLENQQPSGYRTPHALFAGADPRAQRVETRIQATALIGDAANRVIGEAHLVTGGEEGMMKLQYADGSRASGRTSKGGRKSQEDGIYLSRFLLADGTEVKVLAGADGAGGEGAPGSGAMASSAFLQGVHARVVEAAREGKIASAKDIFEAGVAAVELQRNHPSRNPQGQKGMKDGTGAGAVVVVVGNEAMVASVGDATVFLARLNAEGGYDIQGYSNVDGMPMPNGQGGWVFNQIVRGIHQYEPSLYRIPDLQPGDRFLIASDGFHENTSGGAYKLHGSRDSRKVHGFRPPTQETFATLRGGLKATRGRIDSTILLHDLAVENMKAPGRRIEFEGEQIQLPEHVDIDNIFVVDYEHGKTSASRYEIPLNYSPLEPVPTAEQIAAAEQAAERSTAKGYKVQSGGTDPNYQGRDSGQRIVDFHVKYLDALAGLYGANSDRATRKMLEIYLIFPEVEEAINPSLLARAEDKQKQDTLFDAAKKKIQQNTEVDGNTKALALKELESIKGIQRPFTKPEEADIQRVLDSHGELLGRIFGQGAREAAEVYATVIRNFPDLESLLGPRELAKSENADFGKFFRKNAQLKLHPDRQRFNEIDVATHTFAIAEKLRKLHQDATIQRKAEGWDSPKSLETGLREWSLDRGVEYVVGKNGNSTIRLLLPQDTGVSRQHFKVFARGDSWVAEDLGSTYGIAVNGQPVQRAPLKDGDRINIAHNVELKLEVDSESGAARLVEQPKKPGAGLPVDPELIPASPGIVSFKIRRGGPVLIGRKHIPDAHVSNQQVEFLYKNTGWVVRDHGSDNGTQLNGVDIQKGVEPNTQRRPMGDFKPIKNGDLLRIGGLTFRFNETTSDAVLSLVEGQMAPPSSHYPRAQSPQVPRLALEDGKNYKFNNADGREVAEIFWDGFENGGGEFVLREITNHGQVWIMNGASEEPLSSIAYAMMDGMIFGFGPRPDQAQWYVFKDGTITALHARVASGSATPRQVLAQGNLVPGNWQYFGRQELGGSSNISNRHLGFIFHENRWWVKDMGSSNGTMLNNQRISSVKGQEGEPKPLSPNDIISLGGLRMAFQLRPDGGFTLEAAPAIPAPLDPIPVSIPPSYVPGQAAQAYVPPTLLGQELKMGWARVVRIIEGRGEGGLRSPPAEEPNPREYVLNVPKKSGIFPVLMEKDLATIEDIGDGRYRISNLGFKTGLAITNPAKGKNIQVGMGNTDQALVGDTLEFNGHKITLKP